MCCRAWSRRPRSAATWKNTSPESIMRSSGLAILAQALHAGTLVAPIVRRNVIKLARRFIAEESGNHLTRGAVESAQGAGGLHFGRGRRSDGQRWRSGRRCSSAISIYCAGSPNRATWPACPQIDESPNGKIPRVNLVGEAFVPVRALRSTRPEHRSDGARAPQRIIARGGQTRCGGDRRHGAVRFQRPDAGNLSQCPGGAGVSRASLRGDCAASLPHGLAGGRERVGALGAPANRRIGVRLVKGAYWDSEIAWAKQKSWPIPVFLERPRPMPTTSG